MSKTTPILTLFEYFNARILSTFMCGHALSSNLFYCERIFVYSNVLALFSLAQTLTCHVTICFRTMLENQQNCMLLLLLRHFSFVLSSLNILHKVLPKKILIFFFECFGFILKELERKRKKRKFEGKFLYLPLRSFEAFGSDKPTSEEMSIFRHFIISHYV